MEVLQYAIIARALLSWFLRPENRFYRVLFMMTEPIVAPFRTLLNRFAKRPMMMDFSTILAYIALMFVGMLIDAIRYRLIF